MFFFRALLEGEFDKEAFIGTLEAMLGQEALIELCEKRKKILLFLLLKKVIV